MIKDICIALFVVGSIFVMIYFGGQHDAAKAASCEAKGILYYRSNTSEGMCLPKEYFPFVGD